MKGLEFLLENNYEPNKVKDNLGWWGRKGGGNTLRKLLVRAGVIFAKDSVGRVSIIFGRKSSVQTQYWYIITCQRFCIV